MRRHVKAFTAALAALLFATQAFAAGTVIPLKIYQTGPYGFLVTPQYTQAVVLVANTQQQTTIPTGASWVIFSASSCDFYAAYGTNPTAVVPSGTTSDGTSNELNPTQRNIAGIAKISLISGTTCIITLSYWS